jgi:hypothetical protein
MVWRRQAMMNLRTVNRGPPSSDQATRPNVINYDNYNSNDIPQQCWGLNGNGKTLHIS